MNLNKLYDLLVLVLQLFLPGYDIRGVGNRRRPTGLPAVESTWACDQRLLHTMGAHACPRAMYAVLPGVDFQVMPFSRLHRCLGWSIKPETTSYNLTQQR